VTNIDTKKIFIISLMLPCVLSVKYESEMGDKWFKTYIYISQGGGGVHAVKILNGLNDRAVRSAD
jgi:hypothetical protein